MNTTKLNEVKALIDEGAKFKMHIEGMEKECKDIQKYCLEALDDLQETFRAVVELVKLNPQIMKLSKGSAACEDSLWAGNSSLSGGTGFKYYRDNEGADVVENVSKDGFDLRGIFKIERNYHPVSENSISIVKKHIEAISTMGANISFWTGAKQLADETRLMSETLLESLRISAAAYRDKQKVLLEGGAFLRARASM